MPQEDNYLMKHVPADPAIDRFVTYRIWRLSSKLSRQGAAILRQSNGLKMPEWRVITFLGAYGPLTGAKISELTGVDPGLLSRVFRSLEERGLISTQRRSENRREVEGSLTSRGRMLYEETLPLMAQRQERLMESLTPVERTVFFELILKLEKAADID